MRLRSFEVTMTRRAAVGFWTVGIAIVHVALPVLLARITRRRAFQAAIPVRVVGLASLVGGLAGLIWSLSQHFEAVPEGGYKMALTPNYLLQSGPYRYSRTLCTSGSWPRGVDGVWCWEVRLWQALPSCWRSV
jgi:hypothetical protein